MKPKKPRLILFGGNRKNEDGPLLELALKIKDRFDVMVFTDQFRINLPTKNGEIFRKRLNENNIKWLEDPSNNNLSYARVRLRRLLPTLTKEQISPTMLAGTARRLSSVRRSLERNVSKVLAENAMMFPEVLATIAAATILTAS